MALSIASLSPVSSVLYATQKTQTTAIENQSSISSAFRESLNMRTSPESITGAPPVQYAQSRIATPRTQMQSANQKANQAYNSVAYRFGGAMTSYGSDMQGRAYETPGSMVDAFA